MIKRRNRYSIFIKPLELIIDLFILTLVVFVIQDTNYLNSQFLIYINAYWIFSTFFSQYYQVYRHTVPLRILNLSIRQYLLLGIGFFAFFGIFKEGDLIGNQFLILVSMIVSLFAFRLFLYFLLRFYRSKGKNNRTVVVLGYDDSSKKLMKLLNKKKYLGYRVIGFFSDSENHKKLGNINQSLDFVLKNHIDEIYCSITQIEKEYLNTVTKFANTHNIGVKLIPDTTELYSKKRQVEFYNDSLAILRIERLPFEFTENFIIKRVFDVLFSLMVCVFVLSWLLPVLWVLIKLESKGPAIFKQYREGYNGEKFMCYKFRSMRINDLADKVHASKNDSRITRLGSFLRKTSIDELPQFFNVLKGDMSVVGPRPHLESLALEYQMVVDDYLKRHSVKPGITGLAQVSGFRGEIKKKSDIKNRIRLDIFYIENWSFLLDVKIIIMTILNVIVGEEKAY